MPSKKALLAVTLPPPPEGGYIYAGLPLTPQDHLNIFTLAEMVSDPEKADRFPQWGQRAAALSLTVPQVEMYRRTPEYRKCLQQIAVLMAAEGTAQAVTNIVAFARNGDAGAFKLLAKIGGILESGPGVQINNTQISVSLEQKLEALVDERRTKVIDQ